MTKSNQEETTEIKETAGKEISERRKIRREVANKMGPHFTYCLSQERETEVKKAFQEILVDRAGGPVFAGVGSEEIEFLLEQSEKFNAAEEEPREKMDDVSEQLYALAIRGMEKLDRRAREGQGFVGDYVRGGFGWGQEMRKQERPKEYIKQWQGLDSELSWQLREYFSDIHPGAVALSLTGLDNEKSWQMREELMDRVPLKVLAGLAGLDSERAKELRSKLSKKPEKEKVSKEKNKREDSPQDWKSRHAALEKSKDKGSLISKIISETEGFDSEEAWAFREQITEQLDLAPEDGKVLDSKDNNRAIAMAESVVRIKSDQAKDMLKRLMVPKRYFPKNYNLDKSLLYPEYPIEELFLQNIGPEDEDYIPTLEEKIGADVKTFSRYLPPSEDKRVWKLREKYSSNTDALPGIAVSLTGLDSKKTWDMRKKILEENPKETRYVAVSLQGLDSKQAQEMRQQIIDLDKEHGGTGHEELVKQAA